MALVAWITVITASLFLLLCGVSALLMGTGLAPEGSRLRAISRRVLSLWGLGAAVLGVGLGLLLRKGDKEQGPVKKQIRAQAERRHRRREVLADVAARVRENEASAADRVVTIEVGLENEVRTIRTEVVNTTPGEAAHIWEELRETLHGED